MPVRGHDAQPTAAGMESRLGAEKDRHRRLQAQLATAEAARNKRNKENEQAECAAVMTQEAIAECMARYRICLCSKRIVIPGACFQLASFCSIKAMDGEQLQLEAGMRSIMEALPKKVCRTSGACKGLKVSPFLPYCSHPVPCVPVPGKRAGACAEDPEDAAGGAGQQPKAAARSGPPPLRWSLAGAPQSYSFWGIPAAAAAPTLAARPASQRRDQLAPHTPAQLA